MHGPLVNERRQPAPVMVPVLVSFSGTVEVMVSGGHTGYIDEAVVRTALAYVTPEGFTIDRIDDFEAMPR